MKKVNISASDLKVVVDYSKSLDQIINTGNCYWRDDRITEENFPLPSEFKRERIEISAKLFHFNHRVSSEEAIVKMDKAGYRPATLYELLTLDETYPELQKKFEIVALGSVWRDDDGVRLVSVLSFLGSLHFFRLLWFDRDLSKSFCFLAVKK